MKSTHQCLVVPVKLNKHPNADDLSIVNAFGYVLCVNTEAWTGVDQAVHIPPDSIVDGSRPEFAYLGEGKHHIKVKKLRGVISQGMLVKLPREAENGTDLASELGVEHYEPPIEIEAGSSIVTPPEVAQFKYDVDSIKRYAELFTPGEMVVCTEKIHGSFMRAVWADKFYVGSKNQWYEHDKRTPYSRAVTEQMIEFCKAHPNTSLFGECYGPLQKLHYGQKDPTFICFDVYDGFFTNWDDLKVKLSPFDIPHVPEVARLPFDIEQITPLAEGKTLLDDTHIREGVVVRPLQERFVNEIGRLQLKLVGNGYYEKC